MALDHSCQVQRHPLAERGLDLYETPAAAVEAVLRAEPVPLGVWEPAAGRGAVVRVLRTRGHDVVASDSQRLGHVTESTSAKMGFDIFVDDEFVGTAATKEEARNAIFTVLDGPGGTK
jgi:hypothetical protein